MTKRWRFWKSSVWKTGGYKADREAQVTMDTEHEKSGGHFIFDICSKIEACFAELYHYYSELFSDNPDASALWKKVAEEEENHLRQFEFADRLYRWADFAVTVEIARAQRVCDKMNALLVYVRHTPPALETALNKAIEMEEILADLHMASAVIFADKNTQKLFTAMAQSEQDHIQSLKRFYAIMNLSRTEMPG